MADLLSLGAQGVFAAQQQLNTTGHNIANANTEGYSRQSVEQTTNEPYSLGSKPWGNGVHAKEIYRKYDKFAVNEFNIATSLNSHASTRNAKAAILDEMVAYSGKKIPDNLNEFFGSLKALVDIPSDMGARKIVLQNAKMVSNSLNSIDGILQNQKNDIAEEIKASVELINDIGQKLADIHKSLLSSDSENSDLLDKQQKLINELSKYTQVTVYQRNSDSYNVLIGTGHTLVSSVNANKLATIPNSLDSQKLELALVSGKSIKPISNEDIRGRLGALFEYLDESLKRAQDEIGLLATSFAMRLNDIQLNGYDLNGQVGKNIFRDFNESEIALNRVIKNANSTADISVFITDITKLKLGDYELSFDGSQYKLLDPEKKVVSVTAKGQPPKINIDGLSIQIDKELAAKERVIIRPLREAAGQIYVEMENANEIAAQSFVSSNSQLNGSGDIKILTQGAQKAFQVVISADASEFSVLDMAGNVLLAPQAYPSNKKVLVNGTKFQLTEGAKANDRFVISLTPADGDNSNLLRMQALQSQKIIHQGRSTLVDIFEKLSSDIGIEKASFERLASISQAELDAAKGRVAEISGVNLDEEAANMMKFQQAYMASSRIMSAANQAFEALLNVAR